MNPRTIYIASIHIYPGMEEEFDRFEEEAARIMKRYGGTIERAVRSVRSDDDRYPYELHIVSFPSQHDFEEYRNDPEARALASERRRIIRETLLWEGVEIDRTVANDTDEQDEPNHPATETDRPDSGALNDRC